MHRGANRRPARGLLAEWPTWLALAGCYLAWGLALAAYPSVGLPALVPMALSVGFHSSLQHEILHGHPTRNAALNEALVWLPLGLYIPYRRFRDNHLRHHNDERLTDPHDDPESFYLAEGDYARAGPAMRALLALNATFAGRMVVGPALALNAFWRQEWRRAAGDRELRNAWAHHAAGLAPVLSATFNFPLMTRISVGRHWRALDEATRGRLVEAFGKLSIATYAARFDGYGGERFEGRGEAPARRKTVLVRNRLVKSDGEAVAIDYLLKAAEGRWRVVDVFLDGKYSELALKRSEYGSVIKNHGIEVLIQSLDEKAAELAAKN